jgi:hypothetical protein
VSEEQNLATVQDMYAAFGQGDIATVLGHLAPDIEWVNAGPSAISYFGTHRGHDEVLSRVFQFLGENLDIAVFEPRDFFASGEKVAVILRMEATVRGTGRSFGEDLAHLFTFRDGKVVRFQDIQETAGIAAAFGV